jgi:hypothetical protein
MGGFKSLALGLAAGAIAVAGSWPARGQCRLCDTPSSAVATDKSSQDVSLQLETSINFDRLVVSGDGEGSATLRPDGATLTEGAVGEISPRAMVGSAMIQGEPGKAVRISLPARVVLTSISGGEITLDEVISDLPSLPRLDSAGRLSFRFGGRLRVRGDAEGQYRGDLPIVVEYL